MSMTLEILIGLYILGAILTALACFYVFSKNNIKDDVAIVIISLLWFVLIPYTIAKILYEEYTKHRKE